MCRNISIGGMLVGVEEPRAQGTLVRFDLEIEDGLSIRGLGEVIWMRPRNAEREPEMGIKFRFLEQRDRQMILKLVSQHIKERLEKKHSTEEAAPPTKAPSPPAGSPRVPPAAAASPAAALPGPSYPTPATEAFPPTPGSSAFEEEPRTSPQRPHPRSPTSAEPRETPLDAGALEMRPQGAEDLRQSYQPPPPVRRGRGGRKRAVHRREFPLLPVVALLLLIVGSAGFLYRDAIFGPPVEEPPETPPPNEPSPKTPPPPGLAAGSIEPVDSGAAEKPEENLTEPPPLSVAQESPPAGSRRPAAATARPKPPPPAAPAPFRRVLDISWSRRPGGVRVEVTTDGSIAEGRVKSFRLEGESPREVVDLFGVSQGYGKDEIRLTGAPVERIRIGYHADKKELRLVLDMRDRTSRLSRIQTEGPLIVLLID